jgi:signal transduction histidine kinase
MEPSRGGVAGDLMKRCGILTGWRWVGMVLGMVLGMVYGLAEGTGHWRVYRAESGLREGFALSVNVSSRGNVWVRHPVVSDVSWLDGYQVRAIGGTEDARYPVYESRTGQIWSLYPDGLMEYRRGQWVRFPVEVIRAEHQAGPSRLLRPIPLLPVERDHVLVVLPQQLSKHNPAAGQATLLRRAEQTGLGHFLDLIEARDGGGWLAGTRGLAKLPGPIRRLAADSIWEEHELRPEWGYQIASRPVEDEDGMVMVTAEVPGTSDRVILEFEGGRWVGLIPAPEGTRMAWRTTGGQVWAQARGMLHRWWDGRWEAIQIPGMGRLQIVDVAVEPHGVFWLATAEGLVRHAPESWRQPWAVGVEWGELFAMEEDPRGGLWMSALDGLYHWHEGQRRRVEWPRGFELDLEVGRSLEWLRDRRLVIAERQGVWVFDLATERFTEITHWEGRRSMRLMGRTSDGAVTVMTQAGSVEGADRLEVFDGQQFELVAEMKGEFESEEAWHFAVVQGRDRVWLGTDRGVWQWNPATGRFESIAGLPGGAVNTYLTGPRGRLWIGGEGRVLEYDGRVWTVLQTSLGTVHALHWARDGALWLATSGGVACFVDGSWIEYQREEGLPAGAVWDVVQDRFGHFWIATAGGLYRHYPEADLDEPRSSFDADLTPREVSTLGPVTLVYGGRDKWDYTPADRLLFSHRLNEGPWSTYRRATMVTFSDLSAGKHRLAVRAMDRNRNEESDPAVWEFVAFVPWYAELRLLVLAAGSVLVAGLLAWLAVNRHLRLRRSHAEVERIVADRTRELELANRELLHSHKMRALGTLAAGIAHDFNNLLSIIKGSAQVIESNLDDKEKIRTRLSRIGTMVEQGSGIVRTMLGFSRASDWNERTCDLNRVTLETARLMSEQLGRALRIESQTMDALPQARGVPELIRQILLNLVFNAADAMDGRGTIRLETSRLGSVPDDLLLAPIEAEEYVVMTVRDRGHGISPEVLPRIFEPFFSTKAFSTRRGTGLGLTMVYEIAKELGLGLRVESKVGEGANFSVILPAAQA